MNEKRGVVVSETVSKTVAKGNRVITYKKGDIITDQAYEDAAKFGVKITEDVFENFVPNVKSFSTVQQTLYRRSPKWITPKPKINPNFGKFNKLAIVGSGGVGSHIAHLATIDELACEIVLTDIIPGLASSTAMDIRHAKGIHGSTAKISGGEDIRMIEAADVIVVTAGRPRTPGMARADLLEVNRKVIRSVGDSIKILSPNSTVIIVTNPLDEMTAEIKKVTGFERRKVIGMAGTLDTSRFRNALSFAAKVSPFDVEASVLGTHGEEMVPLVSRAKIKGQPLHKYLSENQIQDCVNEAVTGGGQLVALRKTGASSIAPAHSTVEILEYMLGKKTGCVTVTVLLEGEYGISGVPLGVPCVLNNKGLESIKEIKLSSIELNLLKKAAGSISNRIE